MVDCVHHFSLNVLCAVVSHFASSVNSMQLLFAPSHRHKVMQGSLVKRIKCRYCNISSVTLERSFLLKLKLIEVAAWIPYKYGALGWKKQPAALWLKVAYGEVLTVGSVQSQDLGAKIFQERDLWRLQASSKFSKILGFSIVYCHA